MSANGDLGPAVLNLTGIRANDKNEMILNLTEDGLPVDLSGMTIEAQARADITDFGEAPIIAEIEILDVLGGKLSVCWPGDQVAEVLGNDPSWKGVWDIQQTTGTDRPVTLIAGTFVATQDVTR